MSKSISFILLLLFFSKPIFSQTYTNWLSGSEADISISPQFGVVLAGGGKDNDDAMRWMLKRANGGDVVVIRATGSNGYNDYFFKELGINVNSVETLLIPSKEAANDSYVEKQIRNAEVLFIAGGDQYNYYKFWKDTKVSEAINYLLNTKKATVGGTSAGMAILGKAYYTPDNQGVTSPEALQNPYHLNMSILGRNDFINTPFMNDVVTDTHYDNRNRAGRHFAFLARMSQDWSIKSYGIACNEHTAVCVDDSGKATVFGEDNDDWAYFLQSENTPPEICQKGTPLTWYKGGKAIKAYQLRGTKTGNHFFSLIDWQTGNGGVWYDWYAQNGVFNEIVTTTEDDFFRKNLVIFPSPSDGFISIKMDNLASDTLYAQLLDMQGKKLFEWQINEATRLDISQVPKGIYQLALQIGKLKTTRKIIRL